jgi:large subunit ribosomal protein L6
MTSKVGRKPIMLPKGVEIKIDQSKVSIKGPKGNMFRELPQNCGLVLEGDVLHVSANDETKEANVMTGTTRALLQNCVQGVSVGFVKKLLLVGVGYRVNLKTETHANFTLGFSHPVQYVAPAGIKFVSANQTELEIHGIDKQVVGQVAADIRAFRPPEPYKGKGIRYSDETIILKETKKK